MNASSNLAPHAFLGSELARLRPSFFKVLDEKRTIEAERRLWGEERLAIVPEAS